ncbi:hypothetical protein [Kribbella sp. NPDC004536]|uniref:hypothetical protein n=1 Tax=Kribbella sp. NPDC004536 TaxID=3364106 RepID=UPI0036742EB9
MNDVLTLEFEVRDDRPDWPVVTIRVNGRDLFGQDGWQGFDPAQILGDGSPLVPDDHGRRVAVYRCSCGEPGCGVVAPYIVASPDDWRISWVDFRDYTGVFARPLAPGSDDHEGRSLGFPDLYFGRDQYLDEVRRATNDRSWETPRRQTARLLEEQLGPMPGLRWVSPAWSEEGVVLSIERDDQLLLHLTSSKQDPVDAAADMARRLRSTPSEEWPWKFGL